ncbi:uncharacterized protein LOC127769529 [Oryza glaberrima]|nr:uncharacterized protein LOC127769529 [Oryza glaberrima]
MEHVFEWISFLFFQIDPIPMHIRSMVPSLFSNTLSNIRCRSWWWHYHRVLELESQKRQLENQNWQLEQQNSRLSSEKRDLESRVRRLGYENTNLLEEKMRVAHESSRKVSALEYRVRELEHQNIKLSSELVKQRENTRKAGQLFMNVADTYQQVAEKQIRTKEEELANTRKAGLLLMNAADTYQEVARKQIKAKVKDLEDARKAVLVVMNAADTYQLEAEKKIKDKVEELRVLGVQKAEMDARAASLESGLKTALAKNQELEADCDKVMIENNKLWLEVERLMMELRVMAHKKEAAANAFGAEKAETMKELKDHEMNVEEIPTSMDLMKGENDKIQLEILTAGRNIACLN